MELYPLYNSLRVALISTVIVYFAGIGTARAVSRLPRWARGIADGLLTLPLVLPPTVVGFFLLQLFGINSPIGGLINSGLGIRLTMNWYSAILSTSVVAFPLMYRTARGAFEGMDKELLAAAATLGMSPRQIFRRVQLPICRSSLLAGVVLAFARGLGEYGATSMIAGYIPGRTATISTTVYQLWRQGEEALAYKWAAINLLISFAVLIVLSLMEKRTGEDGR